MSKLPWIKLWFDDLDDDCGCLSLAARGAWIWIIGHLHHTKGETLLTLEGWSRVIRASVQQTAVVMSEIIGSHTCDSNVTHSVTRDALSQNSDALIMIRCRRMAREAKANNLHALRQARYRSKDSGDAHSDAPVTRQKKKQKQKQRLNTTPKPPPGACDGFTDFWQKYPLHKAKSAALKAWNKLKPDAALQCRIKTAVERQSRSPDWLKEDGRFIPYPASWLNGRRWEDEVQNDDSILAEAPGADPPFRLITSADGRRVAVKP